MHQTLPSSSYSYFPLRKQHAGAQRHGLRDLAPGPRFIVRGNRNIFLSIQREGCSCGLLIPAVLLAVEMIGTFFFQWVFGEPRFPSVIFFAPAFQSRWALGPDFDKVNKYLRSDP